MIHGSELFGSSLSTGGRNIMLQARPPLMKLYCNVYIETNSYIRCQVVILDVCLCQVAFLQLTQLDH